MRIELPRYAERFGAVLFHDVQKVYELDGGMVMDDAFSNPFHVIQQIPRERLHEIEKDLVIVIPVRNERLRLLEGVLSGIPHACLPLIISNSQTTPLDRFRMERQAVDTFCRYAKKNYVMAHQRSSELAALFQAAGYHALLDEEGFIRNGKAEGMIAGLLLARLLGKKYIGFVDADNYFPGAVFEYVRIFAAGLSQSPSPYSMVRIQWHSKPKISGTGLFFAKWGRVSRITNSFLNRFISQYTGFETDVVKTGNAGEHALSMELALQLEYSAGFSVETNHFINMFEQFGGIQGNVAAVEALQAGVHLYQIESRNPHLHDGKENGHLEEMIEASLSVLYHTQLCPELLRQEILDELVRLNILKKGQEPALPHQYPALAGINFDKASKQFDLEKHSNF